MLSVLFGFFLINQIQPEERDRKAQGIQEPLGKWETDSSPHVYYIAEIRKNVK